MNIKKLVAGILIFSMVVPTMSNINYNNIIQANAEVINGIDKQQYEDLTNQMLNLLNEYRTANGLEPVKSSPLMMEMAQQRAKEQEETGLSHTRPDNSICFTIFYDNDVSCYTYGENASMGRSTPEATMEGWKQSEGHNANMLEDDFTHVGIGITYYNGTYYWIQLFAGTVDEKITSNDYVSKDTSSTTTTTDTTTTTLLGDVNSDGQVKSNDLLSLKRYLLGLEELSAQSLKNSDLSQDGQVKSNDLLQLKSILLGLE